jgi:hypothetical protein
VDRQVKPSDIVLMVSGAAALIFSFLPWFDGSDLGGPEYSAWSTDLTFPLATYIPLIGIILGAQVALTKFANVNLPERFLNFTWAQVHFVLALFAVLLALGWLIVDPGIDKGIGLWLSILAAIGLMVGAVLEHVEGEQAVAPGAGTVPPTPF